MTIYGPMICNAKLSIRKYRRTLRRSQIATLQTRALKAYAEQWKRYPNSKAIIDMRLGNKTNTNIFRDGQDPFFNVRHPQWLPIKGAIPDRLASHPDVDKIILKDTDPHKGVCLTLWSYNSAHIERFKYLCRANLPKNLGWFHQGNSRTFQMFELWTPKAYAMITIARFISKEMGLKLIVNLSKDYPVGGEIFSKPFERFDPDMHTFNDFFGQ